IAKVTDYTYTTSTTSIKTVEKVETTNEELPKINKWELGNGIAFEIKEDDLKDGATYATYEFTALTDGEKLVYADRFGKEILDAEGIMGEKIVTEISQGVRVEYNITAVDVIKFNDGKDDRDLRIILED